MNDDENRLVTVCRACGRASCWHGEFFCEEYLYADTAEMTVKELRELDVEHPDNYSEEKIRKVCGS